MSVCWRAVDLHRAWSFSLCEGEKLRVVIPPPRGGLEEQKGALEAWEWLPPGLDLLSALDLPGSNQEEPSDMQQKEKRNTDATNVHIAET